MPGPWWLSSFTVCAWETVSLDAPAAVAIERQARLEHPAAAILRSCQRLEAYGFGGCACGAPLRLTGEAALARLTCVAAGLESIVLGEAQILGQVRQAFAGTRGPLRLAADLALGAARETRRNLPGASNAGHLLDRGLRLAGLAPGGGLLVLGTGTMARLVAGRARQLGFAVTVAGRTRPPWSDAFASLDRITSLEAFDVIVGCLGSGAGLVDVRLLPPARLLLDLGTPRNFATAPGVQAITLQHLVVDETSRPHAVRLRQRLAEAARTALRRRLASLAEDAGHPIGRFRLAAQRLADAAVAAVTADLDSADRERVECAVRSHLNRLLHPLTVALRAQQADALAVRLALELEGACSDLPARPRALPGPCAEAAADTGCTRL